MFCHKCGKSVKENTVFCAYCGTKLTARATAEPDKEEMLLGVANARTPIKEKRRNGRNILIGGGVVIAIVIGVLLFRHNMSPSIKGEWVCQDYFSFSGYGYNVGCTMKITDEEIGLYGDDFFQEGTYHMTDEKLTIMVEGHWGGRDSYNYKLIGKDWLKLTQEGNVDGFHYTDEYLFKRKK